MSWLWTGATAGARSADHERVRLELTATTAGGDMVLRRRDGVEHSRWPIAAEDRLVALERLEAGLTAPVRPWSLTALDTALLREGYRRTGGWRPGDGGPACEATDTTDL